MRVEGNCDERGSSEYNLALGQRRANNVKKLLILSGAKASQIETISFGEEKPRCSRTSMKLAGRKIDALTSIT